MINLNINNNTVFIYFFKNSVYILLFVKCQCLIIIINCTQYNNCIIILYRCKNIYFLFFDHYDYELLIYLIIFLLLVFNLYISIPVLTDLSTSEVGTLKIKLTTQNN